MELHTLLPRSLSLLRICGLLLCLALLAGAASGASTDLHVVKLAADGTTVIAERTVDYRWLEANLPVKGDGSTHYYHQGPTFDDADLWDPTESKNVEDKDMGAVRGTALRDLCGLAGGMSSGDALLVRSSDGFSKRFSYGSVYSPSARQGQMVLTWFKAGEGYVPSYSTGMRLVFFADTSTNPWGKHVFGNADMKASMPSNEWHFFNGVYPTTTGLSVQSVSELRILSTQPAATTAATTATPRPTTTAAVTPAKSPTTTAQATPQGTASATTSPATPTGSTPVPSVQPTVSAGTGVATASTAPPGTVATVESVVTAPYDDGGSVVTTTRPTATATAGTTATTAPPTADAGTAGTKTVLTTAPDANATANATTSPPESPVPTATGYDHTYDYSVSTGLDYTTDFEEDVTVTETPTPTPTPTVAATATELVAVLPAVTAPPSPTPAIAPSLSTTTPQDDRASTRSLSFTLSFQVRESGNGPAVTSEPRRSAVIVSPASPLGGLWAFMKAIARLIDPFFT